MKNAWGGIFIVTHLRTPCKTRDLSVCVCVCSFACLFTILQSAVTKHKHTRSSLIRSVQSLHQRITINCHLSQLKRCEGSALAFRSRREKQLIGCDGTRVRLAPRGHLPAQNQAFIVGEGPLGGPPSNLTPILLSVSPAGGSSHS